MDFCTGLYSWNFLQDDAILLKRSKNYNLTIDFISQTWWCCMLKCNAVYTLIFHRYIERIAVQCKVVDTLQRFHISRKRSCPTKICCSTLHHWIYRIRCWLVTKTMFHIVSCLPHAHSTNTWISRKLVRLNSTTRTTRNNK